MESTAAVGRRRAGWPVKGSPMEALLIKRVGLIGVAAFNADEAVGAAEYAGEKRQCFLEIVVEAHEGFEHGGGEDLAAAGTGRSVDACRSIGGDGDGFGLRLRQELEIGGGRRGGGERDAA